MNSQLETNLSDKVEFLINEQLCNWQLARNNYEELNSVLLREFDFGAFSVKVQFNPARIISSAAKTDAKSIAARKCFLCAENRDEAQKSVEWGDYDILVNPYPIFSPHLVIAHKLHAKQEIVPYINDMLAISSKLHNYVLFFNGAQAGASAPDHMHFQACKVTTLPLVADYFRLKELGQVEQLDSFVYSMKNYLRTVFCIEADSQDDISSTFRALFNSENANISFSESMVNVISYVSDERYYLFVIPRLTYRPSQYFATDESQRLLISPATVEMAGLFITPIREHFDKLMKGDVVDIFHQVSLKV